MSRIRKISIVMALVITFMFFSIIIYFTGYMPSSKSTDTGAEITSTILVASYDISANSILKQEDIKELQIPRQFVIDGATTKGEDIVGKLLKENIYKGEQILNSKFYSSNEKDRVSVTVPYGQRAIALSIDAVNGLAGNIKQGDYIDILTVLKPPYTQSETAVTIFQNVYIMDFKLVGDNYLMSFYMKPEDINKLILLEQVSTIRISLRNISDRDIKPNYKINTTILK
jgi:Flp pilus assembly protein CpaB